MHNTCRFAFALLALALVLGRGGQLAFTGGSVSARLLRRAPRRRRGLPRAARTARDAAPREVFVHVYGDALLLHVVVPEDHRSALAGACNELVVDDDGDRNELAAGASGPHRDHRTAAHLPLDHREGWQRDAPELARELPADDRDRSAGIDDRSRDGVALRVAFGVETEQLNARKDVAHGRECTTRQREGHRRTARARAREKAARPALRALGLAVLLMVLGGCGAPFVLDLFTNDGAPFAGGATTSSSSSSGGAGSSSTGGAGGASTSSSSTSSSSTSSSSTGGAGGASTSSSSTSSSSMSSSSTGGAGGAGTSSSSTSSSSTSSSSSGTCAHDWCAAGAPLDADCDPCVAFACGDVPDCCVSGWSALCSNYANQYCAANVPGAALRPCDTPAAGTCTHSICTVGAPLVGGQADACNWCAYLICEGGGNGADCCSSAWDAGCVAKVATSCGLACPGG